jgi:hypothetical protein
MTWFKSSQDLTNNIQLLRQQFDLLWQPWHLNNWPVLKQMIQNLRMMNYLHKSSNNNLFMYPSELAKDSTLYVIVKNLQ